MVVVWAGGQRSVWDAGASLRVVHGGLKTQGHGAWRRGRRQGLVKYMPSGVVSVTCASSADAETDPGQKRLTKRLPQVASLSSDYNLDALKCCNLCRNSQGL